MAELLLPRLGAELSKREAKIITKTLEGTEHAPERVKSMCYPPTSQGTNKFSDHFSQKNINSEHIIATTRTVRGT